MRRNPALYTARTAEKTFCPTDGCGRNPLLLSHPDFGPTLPAFYVCECGFIGQAGVGPVRKATPSRLSRWHYAAIVARRRLRQLAPVYTIAKSAPLHAQLTEVMHRVKACDGSTGEDGACDCARYIGGLLVRYGAHGKR